MFGHNVFDSYHGSTRTYAAEPDLTQVQDYHPEAFSRFTVTDLTITPEKTLKGAGEKGFHFTTKGTHSIKVKITGPGAGTMPSSWVTLGPGDSFYRSGTDDKMHHVTAAGVKTTYNGADSTYYINWANPVEMCADTNSNTNADGTCAAGCVSGFEEDATGTCVPAATGGTGGAGTQHNIDSSPIQIAPTSGGTKKSKMIPMLAVGGIVVVGAVAAMAMKKKKKAVV
jgi:hypothetical protein